ncbi:translation initiation factor eIF-2B subunit alpha isoform X2 [Daktulosphaira vitifoliae]|uniref:translation initiation factor eIF-2B subunit alpha isoform X1 n=1 Tax=Daktulosphaira vitifoliae TaxID=58002 RepID=UPI0021AA98D8|nr:translation initiation factor eIF-2B subunit alpha isoform X1 [Daktulosphaira vitifoliae]XP_050538850.1 translation initiation factor eIF-2B subunit alpha isoform X2 [Daktulosphaira vitifoliae]
MREEEVLNYFTNIMEKKPDVTASIAAIITLMKLLELDKSETVQELDFNLQSAVEIISKGSSRSTGVSSGCALFMRFITFAKLDNISFAECKKVMLDRGKVFLKKLTEARNKVAKITLPFIVDGANILTHSKSRVVLEAMQLASNAQKRFHVYVTESTIDNSGKEMYKCLNELKIPCTIILDSAVGYIMEKIDMVMVGAECVVESGGIINKIGSSTMAICAKEFKKPFYVLTESYKFSRIYPLNQRDLPDNFMYSSNNGNNTNVHPIVDYTHPTYITLLFTDLGILMPSAVSDELIKLYL